MCISNCYSQPLREATEMAGREAGRKKLDLHPFPVGANFRHDWEKGYEAGLQDRRREMVKRLRKEGGI